jgi:hypothetical protein
VADHNAPAQITEIPGTPPITVSRWATKDAVLLGVVVDPSEPPCTTGEHGWVGSDRHSECLDCGLRRERMTIPCPGDCYLDFAELEYIDQS